MGAALRGFVSPVSWLFMQMCTDVWSSARVIVCFAAKPHITAMWIVQRSNFVTPLTMSVGMHGGNFVTPLTLSVGMHGGMY